MADRTVADVSDRLDKTNERLDALKDEVHSLRAEVKEEIGELRAEFREFRSRIEALISVARFWAGAIVAVLSAVLGVLITLIVWAIYGAGEIRSEIRHLSDAISGLTKRVEALERSDR
jgi:methyl-accepting chemotaxis protein